MLWVVAHFRRKICTWNVKRSSGGLYSSLVSNECEEPPALGLVVRSARIAQNPGKDGVVSLGKSFVNDADVNAVIVEADS